ncbi:hypothetical protein, partial [Pontibacter ummariensis]|uniref:hypothetical protein n=1 Tax=Pontibacter ummariensis TaxID=1610492 RepID=UPI001C62AFF9
MACLEFNSIKDGFRISYHGDFFPCTFHCAYSAYSKDAETAKKETTTAFFRLSTATAAKDFSV